jgi:Protein of unknown function (DUF3455)
MTRLTRLCRAVGVGLAVATATLGMTQAADAAPAPADVPANLVPEGASQFLTAHAKGVQIYKCQSATTNGATTFSWVFQGPRATLTGDNGQVVATHFAGPGGPTDPRWLAPDKSSVAGKVTARFPLAENFDPATAKDIQQLLLAGTPSGTGVFGATTFIQRLNTQGGTQPPTAECKAQTADKVKEVPYQADYVFFKAAA